MNKVTTRVQETWDLCPKEFKVFAYVVLAAVLEQLAKDLNVDFFSFLPEVYRVAAYNIVVVFIVETIKRLRESETGGK